jgi:hypothetical protein
MLVNVRRSFCSSEAREDTVASNRRSAGVSEATLYRWLDEVLVGSATRLKGKDAVSRATAEIEDLKQAITKRDQVIGITIANCIMSVSAGDFD